MDKGLRPARNDRCGRFHQNGQSADSVREIEANRVIGYLFRYVHMQKTRHLFPEAPRFFIPRQMARISLKHYAQHQDSTSSRLKISVWSLYEKISP
jgi:hypothetical protein